LLEVIQPGFKVCAHAIAAVALVSNRIQEALRQKTIVSRTVPAVTMMTTMTTMMMMMTMMAMTTMTRTFYLLQTYSLR
jgi:hypothetical protein